MKLPLYQVDAFTNRVFGGNPAAVVLLDDWLPDSTLAAIAAENNLAETAFIVPRGDVMPLRWFTPTVEVDLCGHATLAAAHVLFRYILPSAKHVTFSTRSGNLTVTRDGELLSMDFPSRPGKSMEVTSTLVSALGVRPHEAYLARDLLAIFDSESQVRNFQPDFGRIARLMCLRLSFLHRATPWITSIASSHRARGSRKTRLPGLRIARSFRIGRCVLASQNSTRNNFRPVVGSFTADCRTIAF